MITTTEPKWAAMRTDESRRVEDVLRAAGFERADAYRYNAASIRVRVIDARFEGLLNDARHDLLDPILEQLPERTQGDILTLHAFAPSELAASPRPTWEAKWNAEFNDPSPSVL